MKQRNFFSIPSPCQDVCQMNKQGICLGCMRNREERLYWQMYDDDRKAIILEKCSQRRQRYRRAAYNQALKEKQQQRKQSTLEQYQQISLFNEDKD